MPLDETTRTQISELLTQHKVLLFMKGSPDAPQCGFSKTTVEILDFVLPDGTDYCAVDVLSDPAIRDGIKEFSDWPTIPQLYADGEFIGGCDIVKEMFQSGEIYEALGVEKPVWKTPSITISDEAVAKIKEAMGDDTSQVLAATRRWAQHSLRNLGERRRLHHRQPQRTATGQRDQRQGTQGADG